MCFYGKLKLLKSELLKRKTKCQLHKTIILPAVLYGSESWTMSNAHEALLAGSETEILRRIYGAVQIDGAWRKRHNNREICYLLNDADIIRRIKITLLKLAGYITRRKNEELIKRIRLVKPEGKERKVDQERYG
jgi:hypothetical protein